jgi:hypothetical protein
LKLRNNLSKWHTTAKIGFAGTVTGIPDVGRKTYWQAGYILSKC